MTAVTDTKLILETLAGKTLADDKMILVVNNYLAANVDMAVEDPLLVDMTNEELAQKFMDVTLRILKDSVKRGAEQKARAANDAAVATASDDSIVDL